MESEPAIVPFRQSSAEDASDRAPFLRRAVSAKGTATRGLFAGEWLAAAPRPRVERVHEERAASSPLSPAGGEVGLVNWCGGGVSPLSDDSRLLRECIEGLASIPAGPSAPSPLREPDSLEIKFRGDRSPGTGVHLEGILEGGHEGPACVRRRRARLSKAGSARSRDSLEVSPPSVGTARAAMRTGYALGRPSADSLPATNNSPTDSARDVGSDSTHRGGRPNRPRSAVARSQAGARAVEGAARPARPSTACGARGFGGERGSMGPRDAAAVNAQRPWTQTRGQRPQLNWVDPMKLTGQRRVAYLRKALAEARGNAVGIDQLLFFDLEGEVGKGAFGAVRLATHVLTGEKVVLKTIEKYKVAALLRSQGVTGDLDAACLNEARMLAALDHPHVLRLHQVIETPKRVHLVLDYVPAGTLGEYLRFRRRLPEGEAAHIFQQLCLAVAHCHARKVAHRDIKPENVMLLEDQSVVLVDFGLAHATGVKLKQQCGTPMFAAPEIWANVPYAGPPADVWSLGVSLYWMVAGAPPFSYARGDAMFKAVSAAAYAPPPPPASLELIAFLALMLQSRPARRARAAALLDHEWLRRARAPPAPAPGPAGSDGARGVVHGLAWAEAEDVRREAGDDPAVQLAMHAAGFDCATLADDRAATRRSAATTAYTLFGRARLAAARAPAAGRPRSAGSGL